VGLIVGTEVIRAAAPGIFLYTGGMSVPAFACGAMQSLDASDDGTSDERYRSTERPIPNTPHLYVSIAATRGDMAVGRFVRPHCSLG